MILIYPAVFEPCQEGGYLVTVPDLPGCVTEGDTLAEAILMGQDAASGWVLSELEGGKSAPAATPIGQIQPAEGSIVSLLTLDMDAYAEKYGAKAVRKNVTVPAWLNTFGENRQVNFSQMLTDALFQLYQQTNG